MARLSCLCCLIYLTWFGQSAFGEALGDRLNFVVILADDLGYGDLGCYGGLQNATPNIDRLASDGLRFSDFHSNGPMCTPTRAALLTGRYQQRFGPALDGALSGKTQGHLGLPLRAKTLAEVLKQNGYVTGMFGKWHLGYRLPHLPTRQGFDEFRGLTSGDGDHHSHVDRSGNPDWWHGERLAPEAGYTADLLTQHSVDFITRHRDKPFFLYVPHLAIHFPWQGPDDPAHRVAGRDYANDKWGIVPNPRNVRPHVREMIRSLDESVGRIVEAIRKHDLQNHTLVWFLSDNGGYLNYGETFDNISSNGPLRGQKTELYEGGHRVPAIAWWPGRIRPRVCDQTTATMDLFPTICNLAGVQQSRELDGCDLSELLLNDQQLAPRTLFWRMDDEYAIRRAQWKLIVKGPAPPELYDLSTDLAEQSDLAGERPGLVKNLLQAYHEWNRRMPTTNQ